MADKVVQLKNKDGDKLYPVSVLPGERILWEDSMEPAPTMENIEDMTGATASAAGKHGLVPAPAAGDQDKVLKGDGTWGTASGGATVWRTTQSMPSAQDATNTITYSTLSDPTGAKIYTAAVIGDLVIDGSGRMGQITSITAGSNLCEVTMVLTKMTGATSSASGKGGLVPFPNSAAVNKFLKGDGTWSDANFYMGYSSLVTLNTTIGQTTTVSNYLTNLTSWDGTLSSITPPVGSIVIDSAGTIGYIISVSGSNAVVGTMHVAKGEDSLYLGWDEVILTGDSTHPMGVTTSSSGAIGGGWIARPMGHGYYELSGDMYFANATSQSATGWKDLFWIDTTKWDMDYQEFRNYFGAPPSEPTTGSGLYNAPYLKARTLGTKYIDAATGYVNTCFELIYTFTSSSCSTLNSYGIYYKYYVTNGMLNNAGGINAHFEHLYLKKKS